MGISFATMASSQDGRKSGISSAISASRGWRQTMARPKRTNPMNTKMPAIPRYPNSFSMST